VSRVPLGLETRRVEDLGAELEAVKTKVKKVKKVKAKAKAEEEAKEERQTSATGHQSGGGAASRLGVALGLEGRAEALTTQQWRVRNGMFPRFPTASSSPLHAPCVPLFSTGSST
jgi:hypothetical protein